MPTPFEIDRFLVLDATDTGGTLTLDTPWFSDASFNDSVFDMNDDGNADRTDHFFAPFAPYSGYTITIFGDQYAIFHDTIGFLSSFGDYLIPYSSDVRYLGLYLDSQYVHPGLYPITFAGDDAAVVNLCFLGGTQIATPSGERAVEDLTIGELIRTADGRDVPVKWIGTQVVTSPFVNMAIDARLTPVCISAGALGNHSDLYVSPDHGMIVDRLVINAGALVNGTTIRAVPTSELPRTLTYYHVETEEHDVILANGAPAETFIDYLGRRAFDNHREYLDLYGAERIIREMDRPRVSAARLVPGKIKARLGIARNAGAFEGSKVA